MAEGSECLLLRALLIVHPLYTRLFLCVRQRECKVCCCGDVLLTCVPFVLFEQKKAEEAHRILEGLGPRVELVSPHFSPYFLFSHIVPLFSPSIFSVKNSLRCQPIPLYSFIALAQYSFQRQMGSGVTLAIYVRVDFDRVFRLSSCSVSRYIKTMYMFLLHSF